MTIADVLNEPIESPFNTFTSVKRTNPKLKLTVWECSGDPTHTAKGYHWLIMAHVAIPASCEPFGFSYECAKGIEPTIEQAFSVSGQEMKILKERL